MTKQELAAAMYETMIALGVRNNLGFERQPREFKMLNDNERAKWIEWADTVMARVIRSNVTPIKPPS